MMPSRMRGEVHNIMEDECFLSVRLRESSSVKDPRTPESASLEDHGTRPVTKIRYKKRVSTTMR
jgi:hypothetical protein